MSTVLRASDISSSSDSQRRSLPGWLREPLLHFLVVGAALFGIDHFIASRTEDPRTIVIDAAIDSEARRVFKDARGREPNEEELYALRRVWLDNEVLYREGLALGLEKGDTAIRERVIFKALSTIDAGLKVPPIDAAGLRAWFERNRAKYDEPTRYDFEEAVLAGDKTEASMRSFAAALNNGTQGDEQAGLRVFKARPRDNIVQSYGEPFLTELERSSVGEWRVLPSSSGLRVVRLQATTPARPADFENLRGVILQDWTDATMSEQRSAAVRAMAKKYVVKVQGKEQ